MTGTKLKALQVQPFEATTVEDLAVAIRTWIRSTAGERTVLEVHYQATGSSFTALLFYTE